MILKLKSCKVCRKKFTLLNPMARVCGLECAIALGQAVTRKKVAQQEAIDRRDDKVKRDKLKTRADWIKDAQTAFNAWVRVRDAGKPCICCGRHSAGQTHGGDFDAGHYRSRGSAPHLRFDERNVHAQLKQCNRYDSGNVVGYRIGLIGRIGSAAVDALECDQTPRNHTIDDLKAIKADYTTRARELRRELA